MNDLNHYLLPSSSGVRCLDRFDILCSEEDTFPFWALLGKVLSLEIRDVAALVQLLDTINVTLRSRSLSDYGLLQEVLDLRGLTFFSRVWPVLAKIALEMPDLFPEGRLPMLSSQTPSVRLSRKQTACLIVHQFLCTFSAPHSRDEYYDFSIWYFEEQPRPQACRLYLEGMLTYFDHITQSPSTLHKSEADLEFRLVTSAMTAVEDIFTEAEITRFDAPRIDLDHIGLPDGACVVSANKVVGFGRSATQEELQVGTSPEACVVTLITPVLHNDQVLIVRGAELVMGVTGDRLSLQYNKLHENQSDWAFQQNTWEKRTMLFMDALELDLAEREDGLLPDLLPSNIARELQKAYTAFSSGDYSHVVTGLWGCGAFCGNPDVKSVIMWCAASMAGTRLKLVCSGKAQIEFADRFEVFCNFILKHGCSVTEVRKTLSSIEDDERQKPTPVLSILQEDLT